MKTPMLKQKGFVSIFSVLIIMSVLTLVAIGFSNITRDAQKRTLDNQLNTQAFYAAESGVNDAKKVLANTPTFSKSTCQESPAIAGFNYTLDATLNVGYSCVLVTPATDFKFDSVPIDGQGAPRTGTVENSGPDFLGGFDVTWSGPAGPAAPIPNPGSPYPTILDTSAAWGNRLGVLRVDLTPIDGSLDMQTLTTKSYGFYIYPSQNAALGPYFALNGTADQAKLIYVRCAGASAPCKATIKLGGSTNRKYFVRVQSLYNAVGSLVIDNFKNNFGGALTTKTSQVVIDSTGKASGVLRRIQVRVKQEGFDNFSSDFAIQSGSTICKRLQVPVADNLTPTTTDNADAVCQPI